MINPTHFFLIQSFQFMLKSNNIIQIEYIRYVLLKTYERYLLQSMIYYTSVYTLFIYM